MNDQVEFAFWKAVIAAVGALSVALIGGYIGRKWPQARAKSSEDEGLVSVATDFSEALMRRIEQLEAGQDRSEGYIRELRTLLEKAERNRADAKLLHEDCEQRLTAMKSELEGELLDMKTAMAKAGIVM